MSARMKIDRRVAIFMGLVIAPLVALPVFADSANVQSSQLWEYTNPTYGIVLAKIGARI